MKKIVTLRNAEDDILRRKADPIVDFENEIPDLTGELSTILKKGSGIGLAAPQVGISKRFFITNLPDDEIRFFANPEIIATSRETSMYEEGCLSIPEIYAQVERPVGVTVQCINKRGRSVRIEASGLLARVIQHELDHLDGKLFIDYLPEKQREKILKAYSKCKRAS